MPAYPEWCRKQHRSGVKAGDRLDAAQIKTDAALANANGQIKACAGWYDNLKSGIEGRT